MKKNKNSIKSLIFTVLTVLSFRSIAFDHYRVPTGSMIPTINIGDQVVVNKFAYGVKLPFSEFIGDPIYLSKFSGPKRGDVIVFKYPVDPNINYLKRVIGVPGDKIMVINKRLFINDKPVLMYAKNDENFKDLMISEYQKYPFKFFQTKTGEKTHSVQFIPQKTSIDNLEPIIVPSGKYFVMGDNRDFSSDSRVWGFVPHENILGRAEFVWLSLSLPFSGGEFKFRPSKIGAVI